MRLTVAILFWSLAILELLALAFMGLFAAAAGPTMAENQDLAGALTDNIFFPMIGVIAAMALLALVGTVWARIAAMAILFAPFVIMSIQSRGPLVREQLAPYSTTRVFQGPNLTDYNDAIQTGDDARARKILADAQVPIEQGMPIKDWRPVHVGPRGDDARIGGLPVWQQNWRSPGEARIKLPHPNETQNIHRFDIREIGPEDRPIRFAASELYEGVWGFYVPVER